MLLPSMTYKEMYDCLAADFDKVKLKKEYLLPRVVREFKKEMKFPAWKWYEYTIPATGNKYIIFFYVENRFSIEKPKVDHFCVVYDDNSRYVIKVGVRPYLPEGGGLMALREIQVYTSHFFARYKERYLKDSSLGSNDVVCRFLSRNMQKTPIKMNEDINRRLDKYGEGAMYGYEVDDGFCFAMTDMQLIKSEEDGSEKDRPIAQYVVYKTFMNKSDLADVQLIAIDKSHDEIWRQSAPILQKLINGTEILILEK